ncbi:hypothetical protein CTI14_35650 [Methylobacterium radiotolerans]|nr:hypothetical protein CTI14_35650 [Methylobacterium radiotolerans]
MECVVYMGSEDVRRQASNVYRMKLLGRDRGARDFRFAHPEGRAERSHARLGHQHRKHVLHRSARWRSRPLSRMVRDFQTVIGNECLTQMPEAIGRQPDYVVASVGGGSNAMGIFHPYIPHEEVAPDRRRSGGRGHGQRQARRIAGRGPGGRAGTATAPTSCRTRMARFRKRIPSPPAWTTRASARNTRGSRIRAEPNTSASPTRKP